MEQPQSTFALSSEHKEASPKPGRKFRDTKGTREKVVAQRGRAKLEMMPWPKGLDQHHMKTNNSPMNTRYSITLTQCIHKKFTHALEYADSKALPLRCPPFGVTTQDPATSLAFSHEKPSLIVDTASRSTSLRICIIVTYMHESGHRMGITVKSCYFIGIYAVIRSSLKGQM